MQYPAWKAADIRIRTASPWLRKSDCGSPCTLTCKTCGCECDDVGVLFLRGQVPTFFQKQLAQEAVLHIEGVAQVMNQVDVVEHLNHGG